MAINGWIPGWTLGVAGNVTDASGLVLPAYGATCLGAVGIANRVVMIDATFIPGPMTYVRAPFSTRSRPPNSRDRRPRVIFSFSAPLRSPALRSSAPASCP